MIAVADLTKVFGRIEAVRGVSFHADAGEAIGLLGPNGSGKTTIMRMLAGVFPPTSGRVEVAGIDVERDSLRARAQVGYRRRRPPGTEMGAEFLDSAPMRAGCAAPDGAPDAVTAQCGPPEVRARLIGHLERLSAAPRPCPGPAARAGGVDPRRADRWPRSPAGGGDPRSLRDLRGRTTVLLSASPKWRPV
jgi:hypothetical protein